MAKENCSKCKRALILDEENLCAFCELSQENMEVNTLDVNCGVCKVIVEEDSEGLYCDVCSSWFHNECNETPLNYELYTLLNEAPKNVKWFCDKCIWETEKWIKGVENKQQKSWKVENLKKILNNLDNKTSSNVNEDATASEDDNGEDIVTITEESSEGVNNEDNAMMNEDGSEEENDEDMINDDDNEENNYEDGKVTNKEGNDEENARINVEKVCEEYNKDLSPALPVTYKENETNENEKDEDNAVINKENNVKRNKKSNKGHRSAILRTKTVNEEQENEEAHGISDSNDWDQTVEKTKKKRIKRKCKICSKYLISDYQLKLHMINKHSHKTEFQCNICSKYLTSNSKLKQHIDTHSSDNSLTCEVCNKKFATKCKITQHKKTHRLNRERPHGCDQCDARFYSKAHLKIHKETHTGVLNSFCDICDKGFRRKDLKVHKMIHSGEKPLKCETCGKGFRSTGPLNLHIKTVHTDIFIALCSLCGFRGKTKCQLNRHMLYVHNDTKFECDICGKKYKTKGSIVAHKRGGSACASLQEISEHKKIRQFKETRNVDTNVKLFECNMCGKIYKSIKIFSLHKCSIHSSIHKFECDICGKKLSKQYISRHRLTCKGSNIHEKREPNIKSYDCNLCGKAFKKKQSFTLHKCGIHSPICDICGKKFSTIKSLSDHKRRVHGSCKVLNTSDSIVQEKRESTSSQGSYPPTEYKKDNSSIPFHENTSIAPAHKPTMQDKGYPSSLLYASNQNTNIYATQYLNSLIPPNSIGITAIIQSSSLNLNDLCDKK